MGAVDVTHGHELPGAACPAAALVWPAILVWAAEPGAAVNAASVTAAAAAASHRTRYVRRLN